MSPYVVLEGSDGCGKSTQAAMLADWLRHGGREVLHLREPGSTPLGEALRRVLLDPASGDVSVLAEALLFTAARAELVRTVIAPALRSGAVVVVERCFLSTWVYQGVAAGPDGVPLELLRELTGRAHGTVWPDRVLVLDVPHDVASRRTGAQRKDRIEARSADYHERVRAGYARLAASEQRCDLIDASGDAGEVHAMVRQRVAELLEVAR